MTKTILITGASTGFGRDTAENGLNVGAGPFVMSGSAHAVVGANASRDEHERHSSRHYSIWRYARTFTDIKRIRN